MQDRLAAHGLAVALVIGACVGGCASLTSQQCAQVDWYHAGLVDGRAGEDAERYAERAAACPATGAAAAEQHYAAGRSAGLAEYCTLEGGVRAGRSGLVYRDVCPEAREADFLSGYYLGALSPEN